MQHESEILPFPNSEKSFSLPDDIIQEVKEGGWRGMSPRFDLERADASLERLVLLVSVSPLDERESAFL